MIGRALCILLLSTSAAFTDDFSDIKLYEFCGAKRGTVEDVACTMYIAGLASGLSKGLTTAALGVTFCPPEQITGGQARLIVAKAMREHPEKLNEDAAAFVAAALVVAFPCKKSN
jgi:hypothetical protein